jgi:aerobic carbon-monoxide dehydrogenase medium subunit
LLAPTPVRAAGAEALLRGAIPDVDVLAELEQVVGAALEPTAELKASAAYKRRTAGVLVARAVQQAWRDAGGDAGQPTGGDRRGRAA